MCRGSPTRGNRLRKMIDVHDVGDAVDDASPVATCRYRRVSAMDQSVARRERMHALRMRTPAPLSARPQATMTQAIAPTAANPIPARQSASPPFFRISRSYKPTSAQAFAIDAPILSGREDLLFPVRRQRLVAGVQELQNPRVWPQGLRPFGNSRGERI